MDKRAVITGIGLLTPLGNSPQEFFDSALKGRSGIGPIRKFDAGPFPVRIGGEIDLSKECPFSMEQTAEMPRVARWAVLAARKAVRDAHLELNREDPYSVDVVLGVSISSLEGLGHDLIDENGAGMAKAGANLPVLMNPAASAVQVSRDLGLNGEATNITSACCSATTAIGYAARLIEHGESACVVTGGADEGVSPLFMGAFGNARCLSRRNEAPEMASRPFDRQRDGHVQSDAACIFIVEEYERAVRRGANIYCTISGFGSTRDSTSALKLGKSEEPSARALELAMARAHCAPEELDYYSAFGVSHPWLDIRETRMLKRVLGDCARRLSISSIKSMLGHPLGAAGAIQAATCAMAIRESAIPPTINFEEADPECDLDYVPNQARSKKVRNAALYALGNGGANAALVLSAC